ncbi:MAG: hypothetical protein GF353_20565 [Candidatus Lokiarchaeota archaeon]|nr:hypothetical protein [Candidatus Lokiarchaeota archaeon]
MEKSPEKIYQKFKTKKIDENTAKTHLFYYIENSKILEKRLRGLKFIQKIESGDKATYHFLENLIICEQNNEIKLSAAQILKDLYQHKAIEPLLWVFIHGDSLELKNSIISYVEELRSEKAKSILINITRENKEIYSQLGIDYFLEADNTVEQNYQDIVNRLKNIIFLSYLKNKIPNLEYKIRDGYVVEISLSHLSKKANSWNLIKYLSLFLKTFSRLNLLKLKNNKINALPPSINNLQDLRVLNLKHNNLKQLPSSICKLETLEILKLNYNSLKELPEEIDGLKLLNSLILRHNSLSNLPNNLGFIPSLKNLDCHGNYFTKFPKSIKKLKKIENLDFGLNRLIKIPKWINKLKKLVSLGLGGNATLQNIDEAIQNFPPLKILDLHNNDIQVLPVSLGDIQSLERLILNNNQIRSLPNSFKQLNCLKVLNLRWNNLKALPRWIGELMSLEILDLWGNDLSSLPSSMEALKNLKVLNLKLNKKLTKIPKFLTSLREEGLEVIL